MRCRFVLYRFKKYWCHLYGFFSYLIWDNVFEILSFLFVVVSFILITFGLLVALILSVFFHTVDKQELVKHCCSLITDPCLTKKPTETYPSGINCRSYYKCSWQNTSMPYCCEEGFAYDDAEGRCVGDEACTIPCSVDSSNFNRQGDVTTKAPKYGETRRQQKEH